MKSSKGVSPRDKSERRQAVFLWGLIGLFICVAAIGWLPQSPSNEEMGGDLGRAYDWISAGFGRNGLWWTPAYLMGHSMSVFAVAFISQLFMTIFIFLGNLFHAPLVGLKTYNLLVLLLSGWGMHRWISDQTQDPKAAAIAALVYVTGPMITLRTCVLEHSGMAMVFVFVPWIFRGIFILSQRSSPKEVLILGFAAAGLALSYTKVALLMIPLLLVWAVFSLTCLPKGMALTVLAQWASSFGVSILLSLPFLIPSLRDFRMMAGFLLEPLQGWQESYAYRSPLAWIDLWRVFLWGSSDAIYRNSHHFHVGLVPVFLLGWCVWSSRLQEFRKTQVGKSALALILAGFLLLWFSSGPKSILGALGAFLAVGQGMRDWTIPLALLMFLFQGYVFWKTVYEIFNQRSRIAWSLFLGFFLIPGFVLIQKLPLFQDIRGPEAFWTVGGYSAWIGGLGLFLSGAVKVISPFRQALILLVFLSVDVPPVLKNYFTRGLPQPLFESYEKLCATIQKAEPGRILPISGRYFYLTLPQKTGLPISTEAAGRHFQLKWIRYMESAGNSSQENLRRYLNVAGVSYIWIDRQDPDTPLTLQQYFQQNFPQVFQDEFFTVLLNPESLYPAFLANQGVTVSPDSYESAQSFLELSRLNFVAVESQSVPPEDLPVTAATMGKNNGEYELSPEFRDRKGDPFVRINSQAPRLNNYGSMMFSVPARSFRSWLVVCEAFHPDWKAFWNGRPVAVCRAVGGLLAVPCPPGAGALRLQYQPPQWYFICYIFGASMWLTASILLVFGSRFGNPWKDFWIGKGFGIDAKGSSS